MTSKSDVITFNTNVFTIPSKTQKASEKIILNLCNHNYKKSNESRWIVWSNIFNNQIKNLVDLEKDKAYYQSKTYINLKNLFIANARNAKRIRQLEYNRIKDIVIKLQRKFRYVKKIDKYT